MFRIAEDCFDEFRGALEKEGYDAVFQAHPLMRVAPPPLRLHRQTTTLRPAPAPRSPRRPPSEARTS